MCKYTKLIKHTLLNNYTYVKDSNPPKKVGLCTNKVFSNISETNERYRMNVLNLLNVCKMRHTTGSGRDRRPQKLDSTCEPGRPLEANIHKQSMKVVNLKVDLGPLGIFLDQGRAQNFSSKILGTTLVKKTPKRTPWGPPVCAPAARDYIHQLKKIIEYNENINKNICYWETCEKGKTIIHKINSNEEDKNIKTWNNTLEKYVTASKTQLNKLKQTLLYSLIQTEQIIIEKEYLDTTFDSLSKEEKHLKIYAVK